MTSTYNLTKNKLPSKGSTNKSANQSNYIIDDSKTLGDWWRSWRSSLLSKYWCKKHFNVKTAIHIEIKRVSLESLWICFQSLSLLKDMQFSSLNRFCSYIEPFFKWFSKAFCASPAMRPTFPASVNPRRAKRWKQRAARSKRNSQAIQLEVGSRSASISPVRGSQAVLFSLIFLWMDESSLPQRRGDVFNIFSMLFFLNYVTKSFLKHVVAHDRSVWHSGDGIASYKHLPYELQFQLPKKCQPLLPSLWR